MIPVPSKWDELKYRTRSGFDGGWIVTLQVFDASGNYPVVYLSDTAREFNSRVWGLLQKTSEFGRSVDIETARFNGAHAIVTLLNPMYWPTDVALPWSRISDRWKISQDSYPGLIGAEIAIGVHPGSYATSIAQILNIYHGTVTRVTVTADSLILYTDERVDQNHRWLPQRYFTRTLFPKMPADTAEQGMPLVYGDHWEQEVLRKTGFAPAVRIDDWKWLVADHVIDAFPTEHRHGATGVQSIWIWIEELQSWARSYAGVTFNVNDIGPDTAGRATFTIDPINAGFDVLIYPTASYPTSSGTDAANPRGSEAIRDYDAATKQSVLANSTTQAEIILEWRQQGDETDDDENNSVAALPGPGTTLYGLQLYCSKPAGITISSATIDLWNGNAWFTISSSIDVTSGEFIHYSVSPGFGFSIFYGQPGSMRWHLGSGASFPAGADHKPFKMRIRFNGSGWTTDSTVVAYIHEARLVMSCQMPRESSRTVGLHWEKQRYHPRNPISGRVEKNRWAYRFVRVPTEDIDAPRIGASVQGREYGAWIDNGGRSNPYSQGQCIQNAPGIVESLLRHELSSASIDQDSFDAMYNDSAVRTAKLYIAAGAREYSRGLLEALCMEHGMLLVRRPNREWRLIPWTGSGELVATLRPDDISDQSPLIDSTDLTDLTTERLYYFNRMADSGAYLRSQRQLSDVNSTRYVGVLPGEDITLRTISAFSSTLPVVKMLDTQSALLALPHVFVKFFVPGFVYLAAEIGDIFRFSDPQFAPILRALGNSWATLDFMITEIAYGANGIQFTCVCWVPDIA